MPNLREHIARSGTPSAGSSSRSTSGAPRPSRINDNIFIDVQTSYSNEHTTLAVRDLLGLNIGVMRNGYPNWGLRNKDLVKLQCADLNLICSMLIPYVNVEYVDDVNDFTHDANIIWNFDTNDSVETSNILFDNNELLDSLSQGIASDELGFLSFGRNKISIKSLKIEIQEQTGLYSVKQFKFSFVIHRPDAFFDEYVKNIFSHDKKFRLKYGYNFNVANSELSSMAHDVLSIINSHDYQTIQFNKWDIKQESNDHNIELEAAAIPVSNKSFMTTKLGTHLLTQEGHNTISEYDSALNNTNDGDPPGRDRDRDRLRRGIENQMNEIVVMAFTKSVNRINCVGDKICLCDILNELSECANYTLSQQYNATFRFVCGDLNDTVEASNTYIGNLWVDKESFKKFNTKIIQSKNIPNPLLYLDNLIGEFFSDYVDFTNVSGKIKDLYDQKIKLESDLSKINNVNAATVGTISNQLEEINDQIDRISLPNIKISVHEHINEDDHSVFYGFVLDTNYGTPKVYSDVDKNAFDRVMESNIGFTHDQHDYNENIDIPESGDINNTSLGFDIPIFNLFSEYTILKTISLSSETDEELQASLIKRMADKNTQGEDIGEAIAINDQFKYLTTKISFSTIGNDAFVPYQNVFFRAYSDINIFSRMYNITGITHNFDVGVWNTEYESVMVAI